MLFRTGRCLVLPRNAIVLPTRVSPVPWRRLDSEASVIERFRSHPDSLNKIPTLPLDGRNFSREPRIATLALDSLSCSVIPKHELLTWSTRFCSGWTYIDDGKLA